MMVGCKLKQLLSKSSSTLSTMSQLLTSHLLLSFPLTGHYMVVREGLTNPWIPDNWSWGGVASDHCPVVAEFYPDVSSKELTRPGVAVVDRGDIMPKHERWQHPQSQWKDGRRKWMTSDFVLPGSCLFFSFFSFLDENEEGKVAFQVSVYLCNINW